MKFKLSKSNWPRLALQWGVILFVAILAILPFFKTFTPDFEAYCPFGGVQALGSFLLNNSLTCTMTSVQIVMGIAMIIGVFLFSKLFCSFICPIGTLSEWLGKLGSKLHVRITIHGVLDKILRSLKYILLFITFYFTFDSSELFCKTFDPYYAVTTGFSSDVVVLWASIAIFVVIIGSIFIRLFWCKYLCPFGALANILKFTVFFVAVIVVYVVLLKLGVDIGFVWPLAIACAGGYIIELTGFRTKIFPLAKITRNTDTCINCQICSLKCPQGIDVANMDVVTDVDCNLCSDCVVACPVNNTLEINRKSWLKWLAPIATIALILIGLYFGNFFEVPTIDQQWYSPEEMSTANVYTRSGLKNIKCFGSSTSFANQMHKVKGVMGVTTYVGSHTVKIYYNPNIVTEQDIEQSIFVPSKTPLRPLANTAKSVQEVSIHLDKFFDALDFSYLSLQLKQETEAVGLISEYGCPVLIHIYFPDNVTIDEDELSRILEADELEYTYKETVKTAEMNYVVVGDYSYKTLPRGEYIQLLFKPYKTTFKRQSQYSDDVTKMYTIPMGKNRTLVKKLPYLSSHLSNNEGITGLQTMLDSNYKQVLAISYIDTMVQPSEIYNLLTSDTLYFTYRNGDTGKIPNEFDFKIGKKKDPEQKD